MDVLLDTHTFLWFVNGDVALSATAKTLIETTSGQVYLSMASIWEMAIKVSVGKLSISRPLGLFIAEQIALNRLVVLGIQIEHVARVSTLPFHHRDPFDRLIIAQSLNAGLPVIGSDGAFDAYGIHRIW